jgi:hypothetical protein
LTASDVFVPDVSVQLVGMLIEMHLVSTAAAQMEDWYRWLGWCVRVNSDPDIVGNGPPASLSSCIACKI